MRVAVIGSRAFTDYEALKETLDELTISHIVSGGANGAEMAEQYANEMGIPFTAHLPDW